ncbi:MAG: hypothetical protein ACT4PP_13540 [Sporichthyaceae bacterium]
MMSYDAAGVFEVLDDADVRAYLGIGITAVCFYIQYVTDIRVGFRQRTHCTPVAANMWNFADDIVYLSLFSHWFGGGEYDHWFTRALWFGLAIWLIAELIVHYQTITYSLGELFPGLARRDALAVYLGAQAALIAALLYLRELIEDPIFMITFSTTVFTAIVFAIPMLMGRGSRRGLPLASARAIAIAPASFLCIFLPAIAPEFDRWPTYLLGGTCLALGVAYNILLMRYPAEPGAVDAGAAAPEASRP